MAQPQAKGFCPLPPQSLLRFSCGMCIILLVDLSSDCLGSHIEYRGGDRELLAVPVDYSELAYQWLDYTGY